MILLSGNISPARGGVERTLRHLAEELRARGLRVACLEVHPGTCPEGVEIVDAPVEWARGPAALLNPGRLRRAVAEALGGVAGEVDQVWARNPLVAEVAAERLPGAGVVFIPPGVARSTVRWDRAWQRRRRLGRLRSWIWRLWFEPRMLAEERRAVQEVDAVVVFSRNMEEMLLEEYGPSLAPRLHVVPPGVDASRFRPAPRGSAPEPEGLPPRPRVVYLGRLEERKGARLLLRAAELLPRASLVFVGSGADGPLLRRRVREGGLADRIVLVGHVDEPERWLAACDVFVLPSVLEPFGHVMLEALASGLPVVGFRRSAGARVAVEDVVEDGRTGVLVGERTPEALAEGIRRALRMREEDPELPVRCRKRALERFRWPRFVDRVLELGRTGVLR